MTKRRLALLSVVIGVIVAATTNASTPSGAWQRAIGIFLVALPFLVWLVFVAVRVGLAIGGELQVATRPIPSPPQIALALQSEWGCQPTVIEVQAVHQMLTSRRNQAIVASGVGIGALYLVGHSGRI